MLLPFRYTQLPVYKKQDRGERIFFNTLHVTVFISQKNWLVASCYVSSPADRCSVVFWCFWNPMKYLIESVHTSVRMKGVRTAYCIHIKFYIGGFTNLKKFIKTKKKFTLKPKCLWRVSRAQFVKYVEKCFAQMILMKMTKKRFLFIFVTSFLSLTMLVITKKKCYAVCVF
jgi:hypothetical protein